MSLAENLLNSLDETAYQNMRIAGGVPEEHIKVGQDRVITVPNSLKTIAVKGDKDIETATIDCVRYWDGHDLSTFAIYLNYILPNGDEGTYIPQSITKSEDTFSFDWQIGSEFTYSQGKLTFWIVAKLTDNSGTLVRQWSSFQNSDCTIAQGGDKIYVPEKQTDQDVISQAISISRASAETAEQQANLAKEAAEKAATDAREAAEDEVSRIIGELGVVQELGDSPNSVVSQLKVTKEFNKTNAKINRNSKRITNIEQGIPEELFVTDDSVAYQKDVPANALPYAEIQMIGGMTYKDGNTLKSAKVTEVKSVGVNLFDLETWKATAATERAAVTYGDNSVTVSAIEGEAFIISEAAGVMVKGGETYTISFVESNTVIESVHYLFKNGKVDNSMKVFYGSPYTFVADADAEYYTLRFGVSDAGSTITFSNIKINKGLTAQPYTPYVEHTLPIPEAVRPANGINENVYDYIEWAEDGSVKQTDRCKKIVVDGSADEDWGYSTDGLGGFSCSAFNNSSGNIVLSSRYSPRIYPWGEFETIGITKGGTLWICAPRTSIEEWRSQLASNPIEIVYELAEPIVTDISNLITADNLIGVEGNGTLTFENEYGYAVPSEVEYQVEV